MQPWRQIGFSRKSIHESSGKLHQLVHIREVRGEAQRDAHSTAALHAQIGQKFIPGHTLLTLKKLWKSLLWLLMKDFMQRLFRQVESGLTCARVAETASTQ